MTLGEWMRQTRAAKGLTMEDCAARAGVAQSVWSDWENDVGERRRKTISKIAIGLDVEVTFALIAAGFVDPSTLPSAEIAQLMATLPEEKQQAIMPVFRAMVQAMNAA